MDATCTIQDSIHVFNLVHKYVSRILGTYQTGGVFPSYTFLSICSYTSTSQKPSSVAK